VPSHLPCFRIQVAQFAIRRLNLAGIDLGMMSEDVLPPCFVDFFKGNNNNILVLLEGACKQKTNSDRSNSRRVQLLSSTLISLHRSPASMGL